MVFCNGMNLNELAWEMWEKLGFSGIDPSVISKTINGKRILTFRQLGVMCKVLSLNQRQRNLLFKSLAKDVLDREGISYDIQNSSALIIEKKLDGSKEFGFENEEVESEYKKILSEVIPQESSLSLAGVYFSQKSFISLIQQAVAKDNLDLKEEFRGFDVRIPTCDFSKTVSNIRDNCMCGYHLALYGVIKALILKRYSRKKIEKEISKWTAFFFPKERVIKYLEQNQLTPLRRLLLDSLVSM